MFSGELPAPQTARAGAYQGTAILRAVRDGDGSREITGYGDAEGRNGRDRYNGLHGPFRSAALAGALRAVSVNAAKALMEIFPVKHKEESHLRIEGGDGNVIFNVIVPANSSQDEETQD